MPRIPTIILSSLSDVKTRVLALKSGADDYIIKPFEKQELLARIESVLRRGPTRHTESVITLADVSIDLTQQIALHNKVNNRINLNLTPIEFKILITLSRHYGTEVSREDLRNQVWGNTFISQRNVDTHICKMRKKLEGTKLDVHNKRGRGYYLTIQDSKLAGSGSQQLELPAFGSNQPGSYITPAASF